MKRKIKALTNAFNETNLSGYSALYQQRKSGTGTTGARMIVKVLQRIRNQVSAHKKAFESSTNRPLADSMGSKMTDSHD